MREGVPVHRARRDAVRRGGPHGEPHDAGRPRRQRRSQAPPRSPPRRAPGRSSRTSSSSERCPHQSRRRAPVASSRRARARGRASGLRPSARELAAARVHRRRRPRGGRSGARRPVGRPPRRPPEPRTALTPKTRHASTRVAANVHVEPGVKPAPETCTTVPPPAIVARGATANATARGTTPTVRASTAPRSARSALSESAMNPDAPPGTAQRPRAPPAARSSVQASRAPPQLQSTADSSHRAGPKARTSTGAPGTACFGKTVAPGAIRAARTNGTPPAEVPTAFNSTAPCRPAGLTHSMFPTPSNRADTGAAVPNAQSVPSATPERQQPSLRQPFLAPETQPG